MRNDAIGNMLGAITIAGHFDIPEVCVFFNNKLFRGNRMIKTDSFGFSPFESPNCRELIKEGI